MLLRNPELILVVLVILQFMSVFIGFITGSQHDINIKSSSVIEQRLVDPLTAKIERWLWNYKYNFLKNKRWTFVFVMIFLKKIIIITLITRVVYGLVFIIPLLLTIWIGFSQGVNLSDPQGKITFTLFMDNIGYLLGSVLGIKFGIEVFDLLIKSGSFSWQLPWNYLLYAGIILLLGSVSETIELKLLINRVDILKVQKNEIESIKLKAVPSIVEEEKK